MRSILLKISLLSSILCVSSISFAQVPKTISYQGTLTDGLGVPVADGAHLVRFRFYNDSLGGSPIYNEIHGVFTKHGLFNAIIGSETPIPDSLTFDHAYYLGISIDNGVELSPRTPFTAVPYAFRALTANALAPSATVQATQLTGPASGDLGGAFPSPTVTHIQSFAVSPSAPSTGQVLQWSGMAWAPATVIQPPTAFNVLSLVFQTLTKSVYQKIDFTVNNSAGGFDDGGNFSLANDEFTAPSDGDYSFSAMVTLDTRNVTPNDIYLSLAVNASTNIYNRFYSVVAGYPLLQVDMPIQLHAGDKVSLQISPNAAAISTMGGNSYGVVRFSGFKIH